MKVILTISGLLIITGAIYVYSTHQQSQLQKKELDFYVTQMEEINLKHLALGKEIKQLQEEIEATERQQNFLVEQLQEIQELIDPEYEQLESEIRRKIAEEFRQQQEFSEQTPLKTSLVRQLSALTAEELNALISVNAQYGEFINSLNVSDERLEKVITTLTDMTDLQRQAIQNLMSQRFFSDLDRRNIRTQMVAINNPKKIREVLSFELTDYELEIFTKFQQNQPAGGVQGVFGTTFIGDPQGRIVDSVELQVSPQNSR